MGSADPPLAASGHHLRLGCFLVDPDVRWSVPGAWLVGLEWFVGLLCMCYVGRDRLRFCLRIRRVFFFFWVWVPAIQESPKLVEMVRNKPYNYFW